MISARRYAPVKACIYCGALRYHDTSKRKLGDEHIIPEGLGGNLLLPEASCERCERTINSFEQRVLTGTYHVARKQMNIRSKKKRKPPPIPLKITFNDGRELRIMIPVEKYPGLIVTLTFFPPRILLNSERLPIEISGGLAMATLPEFGERLNAIIGMPITVFPGTITFEPIRPDATAQRLALMLAKIAHSYATAELGTAGFIPYLRELILGDTPEYLTHYVGGTYDENPIPTKDIFDLELKERADHLGDLHLVCSIRIYSHYQDMPRYLVVVGKKC
jgi:hypothetical protein